MHDPSSTYFPKIFRCFLRIFHCFLLCCLASASCLPVGKHGVLLPSSWGNVYSGGQTLLFCFIPFFVVKFFISPDIDSHGENRRRDTHEFKTDEDALLFRKSQVTQATGTAGRGQELRHQGLCGCTALRQRDTACRAEQEQSFIGHRWTHHPPSGLCRQPTLSQADRGMFRLGQGHRRDTQEPLSVRVEHGCLQPGSPAQSGNGGMSMAWLQGFGVPGNGRIGPDRPISGQRVGATVLHLLPAARKIPSVGLFSTAC